VGEKSGDQPGSLAAEACEAAPVDPQQVADAARVELVEKLARGEGEGAFLVRTSDGGRAVLKIVGGEAPYRPMMEALRARGYPAPAVLDAGRAGDVHYEIMELVAGVPLEAPTLVQVRQLLTCNALQGDVGSVGRGPFIEEMMLSLVDGLDGYCRHASLRAHEPELLDRLRRIGEAAGSVEVAGDDVVHYDFSPYNILADGDVITGVVDWQGATSGDAAFDLVTLAYYTYDGAAHAALVDAALARTDPRAVRLYAAHMVLRQVDWSLRHHDALAARWHRDLGVALLAEVGAG
jgi:hypothetical protein